MKIVSQIQLWTSWKSLLNSGSHLDTDLFALAEVCALLAYSRIILNSVSLAHDVRLRTSIFSITIMGVDHGGTGRQVPQNLE